MSKTDTGLTGDQSQTLEEPATNSTEEAVDEATDSEQSELSLDLIFEILKNERRREVIRYLREHEQQVTLSDLAEHIAALENDTDIASITSSQRKRVYVGLYQCHLPKMADMGIVEFNQNRGFVSLGANANELYPYLDNDTDDGRQWYRYYITVAGFGALLFAGSLLAPTTSLLQEAAVATLTVAVGVCAACHSVVRHRDSD